MYGAQARIATLTRRLVLTAITLLLLVWLLFLLLRPFVHPNTYFVYLVADASGQMAPQAFPLEDFAYLSPLEGAVKLPGESEESIPILPLETPESVDDHLERIAGWNIGRGEVLIVYVKAHGLLIDGDPHLACENFVPQSEPLGVVPVSNLIQQLRNLRAGVKLLVLDTGQVELDRRLGIVGNDFPTALMTEVERANDPDLWVLHSHANLQAATTSRALSRSVFGFMFARGIKGAADFNQDRLVSLDELTDYVRLGVDQWAREYHAGPMGQSPKLYRGVTESAEPASYPLLVSIANVPQEAREEDVAQAMSTAQSPAQRLLLSESVQQHLNTYAEEQQRALTSAFRPDYRTEEILSKVGGAASRKVTSGTDDAPAEDTADDSDSAVGADSEEDTSETTVDEADAQLDADSTELNLEHQPIVAELLGAAWQARDDLLADKTNGPRIIDYAPDLWREFEWELWIAEQEHRSGIGANQIALADKLRDLQTSLDGLLAGEPPRARRNPNVIDRAIARKPVYDPRGERIDSLALAEVLTHFGNPFSDEQRQSIAAFRAAIAKNDRADFDAWIANPANKKIEYYNEVRFARQLAEQLELEWPTIKLAIETRLVGERVAAETAIDVEWFAREIAAADPIRLEGERMLFDRIGSQWHEQAEQNLRQAREAYLAIGLRAEKLRALVQLQRELLLKAPYYVHWRGVIEGNVLAPAHEDISTLLALLNETSQLLEQKEASTLERLYALNDKLVATEERLAGTVTEGQLRDLIDIPSKGDAARLDALLSTPLLPAPLRELVAGNAVSVEGRLMADFEVSLERIKLGQLGRLSRRRWNHFIAQTRLEVQLAGLALIEGDERQSRLQRLQSLIDQLEREHDTNDRSGHGVMSKVHRTLAEQISAVYTELPNRIRRTSQEAADLSSAEDRAAQLARLKAARRGLHLMDPRDIERVEGATLMNQLIAARWYDHLVWQQGRMLDHLADAPLRERAFLADAAERYRRIAEEVPNQPPVLGGPSASMELSGPDYVSLSSSETATATIRLRKRASESDSVWLLVEYDPQVIEVRTSAVRLVYRLDDIRPRIRAQAEAALAKQRMTLLASEPTAAATDSKLESITQAARYPIRPDLAEHPPSIEIAAGEGSELSLEINRISGEAGDTKLLVKAINRDTYLRHEIIVRLPGRETIELVGPSSRADWDATARGLMLHPLPNQTNEFPLYLRNHGDRQRTVDLEWFAPAERLPTVLPSGEQAPEVAEEIIGRLGELKSWKRIEEITLPVGGKPIALVPPPPKPEAAAQPATTAVAAGNGAVAAPTTMLLDHGLLAVITDRETGKVSLRHVEFAPQRPRRYVQATVAYNSTTEQIEVSVKPLNRFAVPPDGIPVELAFAERLPAGSEARLTGVIKSPNFEATLFADVPAVYRRSMTAYIHVDGYPRAFVYDVPIGPQARDIPEQDDLFRIAIASPDRLMAFKSPRDEVPIEVRVDAPRGAFPPDYSNDLVEIGIDVDRDREFRDETTYQFHSDRLVVITAKNLLPDGSIQIDTRVSDFKIDLPTDGLSNAIANLLARVKVGTYVAWSETVPIILDAAPPRVDRVEMNPGRTVEVDKELEISVWGADANLSGMAKVEIGLGSPSGEFADNPAPVEAKLISGIRWSGKLKLEKLEPGLHTVFIRTTDAVGNVSKMHKESIQIVPQGSASSVVEAPKGATVAGIVKYGDDPLGGATVELVPVDQTAPKIDPLEATADGRFAFKSITPGLYTLSARGEARNKLRKAQVDVEVKEGETGVLLFELQPR